MPAPHLPDPGRSAPKPNIGSDGCRWEPSYNLLGSKQKPPIPCFHKQTQVILAYGTEPAKGAPVSSQRKADDRAGGAGSGAVSSGPAAMLAVARHLGLGKGKSDAELLADLARQGGTDANGTTVAGIAKMAQGLGIKSEVRGPSSTGSRSSCSLASLWW